MTNLLKSVVAGVLIAFICFLLFTTSGHSMLVLHVIDQPDEASSLRYGTAACMHCPMYFRFDASPEVIARLLTKHELETVAVMPDFMRQSRDLFHESWWIDSPTLARSKKYWAMYEGTQGGELRIRMAFVDGATVYFATSGYLQPDRYRKVPLAKQK